MIRRVLNAYPTMLRVGFADAVAYRVEFFIWVLTTNMPLVMLALWGAVAQNAPVGRFGQADFVAYFLTSLLVRLLTGCWIAYELTNDIRQGTLAMRLLRPIHPLIAYSAENVAAIPLRGVVTLPLVIILLLICGSDHLTHDPVLILMFVAAVAGAWLITFLVQACIGASSLHLDSANALAELYFGLFGVLSGYLIPLELFPKWLISITSALPFRYQLGFPVELLIGHLSREQSLHEFGIQALWILGWGLILQAVWRTGIRRYASFGG